MEQVQTRREETPISTYVATFKFYDSKKRRLSIFARVVPRDHPDDGDPKEMLEITVLTLSNTPEVKKYFTKKAELKKVEILHDIFSRKEGRKKYEQDCLGGKKCPGQVHTVEILDSRPRYTFLKWCNEHYYRPQKVKKEIEVVKFVRGTAYAHPERKVKVAPSVETT